MIPLPREFYAQEVTKVAKRLLGKLLVSNLPEGRAVGRIVELEAYRSTGDSACHASRGKTRRNATMFGPPGHAYVYCIHARYCFNVVTQPETVPSAVLIRAVEPIGGVPLMQERRGRERLVDLTRGPARTCEALGIHRQHDGHDLTVPDGIWIADDDSASTTPAIGISPRIGVTSDQTLLLRYFSIDNRFVSGTKEQRTPVKMTRLRSP